MKIVASKLHNGLLYLGDINSILSYMSEGGYAILPREDDKGFNIEYMDGWVDFPEVPRWLSDAITLMANDAQWFIIKLIESALYRHHMFVDYDRYSELLLYENIEKYAKYLIEGPPPAEESDEGSDSETP